MATNNAAYCPAMVRAIHAIHSLVLLLALWAGCGTYGGYDAIAKREDKACLVPEQLRTVEPPLETYVDQGITIDYDDLVPRPNPRKGVNMRYAREVHADARAVEQVYYDASQGNERARWLVCIYEVAARFMGREAARHLASLKCLTIANCSVSFDKLPFSEDTASGIRLRGQVGQGFSGQAAIEGVKQELIGNGLTLLIGVKAATRLQTPRATPPRATTRPPERIAKQPYNAHKQRAVREAKHPGKVTSTTVPDPKHRSVKPPDSRRTPGKVPRDVRGFLIFDDVAVFDTRLPKDAWYGKSRKAHMRAATRSLREAIDKGQISKSRFSQEQLQAIRQGKAQIPDHTWHHHQDPGRMQLIPRHFHQQSEHVGGFKMWPRKE